MDATQLLRAARRAGAGLQPQPVRRLHRRTHQPRPPVLLRRLRGHARHRRHHAGHQRAHGGRARRRLLAERAARADQLPHAASRFRATRFRRSSRTRSGRRSRRCIRCPTATRRLPTTSPRRTSRTATSSSTCASTGGRRPAWICRLATAFRTARCSSRLPAPASRSCPATATRSTVARRTWWRRACSVITPRLLNEARFGYTRVANQVNQEGQGTSINRQVGLPELSANPRDWGLSFITVTGYSPLGQEYNNPQKGITDAFQFVDTLTWSPGRASGQRRVRPANRAAGRVPRRPGPRPAGVYPVCVHRQRAGGSAAGPADDHRRRSSSTTRSAFAPRTSASSFRISGARPAR